MLERVSNLHRWLALTCRDVEERGGPRSHSGLRKSGEMSPLDASASPCGDVDDNGYDERRLGTSADRLHVGMRTTVAPTSAARRGLYDWWWRGATVLLGRRLVRSMDWKSGT